MIVDLALAMVTGSRTDSFMYIDIGMPMFIRSNTLPEFSLIGLKIWTAWSKNCPKSIQKWSNMVPKSGSGRLVKQESGQEAILDHDANHDANS